MAVPTAQTGQTLSASETTGAGTQAGGAALRPALPSRRAATAARLIEHDGEAVEEGDPIFLSEVEFRPLAAVGAVVETDWNDLDEI
jgi:hypothetical protein